MPNRVFTLPTTIEPWHMALALCDWINHRPAELEAPDVLTDAGWKYNVESDHAFRADDFRNRHPRRRASAQDVSAVLSLSTRELAVSPRGEVDSTGQFLGAVPHHDNGPLASPTTVPYFLNPIPKESCDVRVL